MVLIIKIMVVVVLTSKIVDVVEEKGHRSLWVKITTPMMWIAGELFAQVAVVIALGITPEQAADPMFEFSPEGSNAMFLISVLRVVGALLAVGAVYLYARSLKTMGPLEDTSFR